MTKYFPDKSDSQKILVSLRMSVSTFIKGLEKKGFLTIKRRGLGMTNIYTLRYRVKQQKTASQKQGRVAS